MPDTPRGGCENRKPLGLPHPCVPSTKNSAGHTVGLRHTSVQCAVSSVGKWAEALTGVHGNKVRVTARPEGPGQPLALLLTQAWASRRHGRDGAACGISGKAGPASPFSLGSSERGAGVARVPTLCCLRWRPGQGLTHRPPRPRAQGLGGLSPAGWTPGVQMWRVRPFSHNAMT